MFKRRLEILFMLMILIASVILVFNYYKSYSFKNNPLPKEYMQAIKQEENNVLKNMQKNFGVAYKFPLIITDKIPGRLYGLTSYKHGKIEVYLNKKVMQESSEYMVDSVIANEYAHALMFALGQDTNEKAGHSKEWQKTCELLGGKDCRQYVNQHEIIMSKMPFK